MRAGWAPLRTDHRLSAWVMRNYRKFFGLTLERPPQRCRRSCYWPPYSAFRFSSLCSRRWTSRLRARRLSRSSVHREIWLLSPARAYQYLLARNQPNRTSLSSWCRSKWLRRAFRGSTCEWSSGSVPGPLCPTRGALLAHHARCPAYYAKPGHLCSPLSPWS